MDSNLEVIAFEGIKEGIKFITDVLNSYPISTNKLLKNTPESQKHLFFRIDIIFTRNEMKGTHATVISSLIKEK